jgi:hypothetical protein
VPSVTTFCRIEFRIAVFVGLRMRRPTTLLSRFPIFVIARGSLPRIDPSIRLPPFAKVAYAAAISSGFAASAPSPIAK